jgi:Flp pilus assembly pilin Flp
MRLIARFVRDEAATSSVKYGLIAACISLAIVTVMHSVGPKLVDTLAAAQ